MKTRGKPLQLNGTRHNEIPIIVVESPPIEDNPEPNGSPLMYPLPYADDADQDLEEEEEATDVPSPLKSETEKDTTDSTDAQQKRRQSLRRNSVSFPSELNALELEALREQYKDHAANQVIIT